eukprot:UN18637
MFDELNNKDVFKNNERWNIVYKRWSFVYSQVQP